jgi:hypothetical protein
VRCSSRFLAIIQFVLASSLFVVAVAVAAVATVAAAAVATVAAAEAAVATIGPYDPATFHRAHCWHSSAIQLANMVAPAVHRHDIQYNSSSKQYFRFSVVPAGIVCSIEYTIAL